MNRIVIRTHIEKSEHYKTKSQILTAIGKTHAITVDPYKGNPLVMWINTNMPLEYVRKINGVLDAIYSNDQTDECT